jgi:hypothetical protein
MDWFVAIVLAFVGVVVLGQLVVALGEAGLLRRAPRDIGCVLLWAWRIWRAVHILRW